MNKPITEYIKKNLKTTSGGIIMREKPIVSEVNGVPTVVYPVYKNGVDTSVRVLA